MSPVDLGSDCRKQRERSLQISGMGPACVLENSEETSRAGAGGAAQDERVESWMEPRTSPPAGGNHISQQTGGRVRGTATLAPRPRWLRDAGAARPPRSYTRPAQVPKSGGRRWSAVFHGRWDLVGPMGRSKLGLRSRGHSGS